MNRTLLIPIAGTVAALLGIVVVRATEQSRRPPAPVLEEFPPSPEEAAGKIREAMEPPVPPAPPEITTIEVLESGAFRDVHEGTEYPTVDALLKAIAPAGAPRPKIKLTNEPGKIAPQAFDAAADILGRQCDVEKDYRAPEQTQPK